MLFHCFTRAATLAAIALAVTPSPVFACSPCGDASSSFAGEVLIDTVVLAWESNEEEVGLLYVVKRYATSDRSDQPVTVAAVPGVGSCGTIRKHGVQDAPDPGTWYYWIEVRTASNGLLCSVAANDGVGLTVEE